MKTVLGFVIGTSLALLAPHAVQARGFGGGFHAGGAEAGGFHAAGGASAGGFRAGGAEAGGFRAGGAEAGGFHAGGAEAGGFRTGGVEAGGFHAGGAEAGGYRAGGVEAGGYRAGGVEAGGYHAGGVAGYGTGHVGLPTDGAFGAGRVGAVGYGAVGHATAAWSGSVAAARGATVRNSFGNYGAFDARWYGAHPGAWAAAGWTAAAAWNAAAWPAVGVWCGWGDSVQPIVYQYGNNIIYQGDQVYYGDQPVATADQYYEQASTLAQSAPPPDPQNTDWMPLGVFSLVQGDQTDSSTMFQLAINKSGALAGNYYSVLTGATLPVHGAVDKKTQRVAWTVGDNKSTVYDAGISSLTQDEAPVLIHMGKERTQQWMLVRLKQPEQAGSEK